MIARFDQTTGLLVRLYSKTPTPNRYDNSMTSILRPTLRNSDQSLGDESKESQAMVVTVHLFT